MSRPPKPLAQTLQLNAVPSQVTHAESHGSQVPLSSAKPSAQEVQLVASVSQVKHTGSHKLQTGDPK